MRPPFAGGQSGRPGFWRVLRHAGHRFGSYSADQRAVLLGSAASLIRIDRLLRRHGYAEAYARATAMPHGLANRVARMTPEQTAQLVDTAARWTIGMHTSCLRRAILLCWLLRSAGTRCGLVSGIERADNRWAGHAWVEIDGVPLGAAGRDAHRFNAMRDQLSRHDPGAGRPNANSPIDPSRR